MTIAMNTEVKWREVEEFRPTIEEYSYIKAITYDGFEYQGKKTKVFAYLGFPDGSPVQGWKMSAKDVTVDVETGVVSGVIPQEAVEYYIHMMFKFENITYHSNSVYVNLSSDTLTE